MVTSPSPVTLYTPSTVNGTRSTLVTLLLSRQPIARKAIARTSTRVAVRITVRLLRLLRISKSSHLVKSQSICHTARTSARGHKRHFCLLLPGSRSRSPRAGLRCVSGTLWRNGNIGQRLAGRKRRGRGEKKRAPRKPIQLPRRPRYHPAGQAGCAYSTYFRNKSDVGIRRKSLCPNSHVILTDEG